MELSPNEVVLNLMALSRQMQELTDQMDKAERDAVNAREDFTMAQAKAFLRASGAMELRKVTAIDVTHDERLAAELAEAVVRGLRRQVSTLGVRIDVGRSAAALVRAEAGLLGVRQ